MSTINTGHIPVPLRRSSRFPTLRCKVPRPRRCSDEHHLIRGISPGPCALKGLSDFAVRNPGPGRSADADFLVKSFGGVLVRGISPGPCACCASALFQPQSAAADSPFQGQAGSASLRRASPLLIRFANSLPLRRAACAAPAGVAFQFCLGKIPAPGGALMSTINTGHIPGPCACCASAPS